MKMLLVLLFLLFNLSVFGQTKVSDFDPAIDSILDRTNTEITVVKALVVKANANRWDTDEDIELQRLTIVQLQINRDFMNLLHEVREFSDEHLPNHSSNSSDAVPPELINKLSSVKRILQELDTELNLLKDCIENNPGIRERYEVSRWLYFRNILQKQKTE